MAIFNSKLLVTEGTCRWASWAQLWPPASQAEITEFDITNFPGEKLIADSVAWRRICHLGGGLKLCHSRLPLFAFTFWLVPSPVSIDSTLRPFCLSISTSVFLCSLYSSDIFALFWDLTIQPIATRNWLGRVVWNQTCEKESCGKPNNQPSSILP